MDIHNSHHYSTFFAPRGYKRMADLGMQIAQQFLSPHDKLIGIIGDAGSGKSIITKGMFPGLELTNDDEGVNVRPLPILYLDNTGFYTPHTYHLDIRFETGFTQMHELAGAILEAVEKGKRVIVEHFDLVYPSLKGLNADLLIGVGEEIIITRPNLFGPEPQDIREIVFKSIKYRRMSHTAEDLCEFVLREWDFKERYSHADVKHGFVLSFRDKPNVDLEQLEQRVSDLIGQDLEVAYKSENHISIGEYTHYCTGPRMHVGTTGQIKNFTLHKEFLQEPITGLYLMVGLVGKDSHQKIGELNTIEQG